MKNPILFLIEILFPKVCLHCGDGFREGLSNVLCLSCFNSIIPYGAPRCTHCGIALPERAFEGVSSFRCRDCGPENYYLDQVVSFGPYAGPLRIAHHAFKFEGMEDLASALSDRMILSILPDFWRGVEVLVPVPLSAERERKRGYNPAKLLAVKISEKAGVPLQDFLRKVRSTKPQMSLSREKRTRNPRGAYQFRKGVHPPFSAVLVDDVYTTGATLEECARVLKAAGVAWVGAVVFGRTEHH